MQYLAKHGRVWQNKKTKKIHGNKIAIGNGDKITNYSQIIDPPALKAKPPVENNEGGNVNGRNNQA